MDRPDHAAPVDRQGRSRLMRSGPARPDSYRGIADAAYCLPPTVACTDRAPIARPSGTCSARGRGPSSAIMPKQPISGASSYFLAKDETIVLGATICPFRGFPSSAYLRVLFLAGTRKAQERSVTLIDLSAKKSCFRHKGSGIIQPAGGLLSDEPSCQIEHQIRNCE
jgi:hypothetical protein